MNTSLLQQIDQTRDDESFETILARCYQIARERARQVHVETRERDERETKESNDDEK